MDKAYTLAAITRPSWRPNNRLHVAVARPLSLQVHNNSVKAEIIAIGSELLTPDRVDTNSLFLTEQLNRLGIEVVRKLVVGDQRGQIRDRKSTRLNSSHLGISYAVFCLKKKKKRCNLASYPMLSC